MATIGIVGGGIIGLCSAYYLKKAGHDVVIVDKNIHAEGASYINAGYVTPSHMVPLAAPGVIWQGIKWMFNPESPFYIKPRLDLDLLSWLWKFYAASTKSAVEKGIPILLDLNLKSRELYMQMRGSGDFTDFPMERKGLFMLYQSEKEGAHEWEVGKKAKALGLDVRQLSMAEVEKMEPNLPMEALGAIYYESDAHSTPSVIMHSLKNWLEENGVETVSENVSEVDYSTSHTTICCANGEKFKVEKAVLAGGASTTKLLKTLGISIPLQAGKGYAIDTDQPISMKYPAILMEARVAVTPMQGFTRFAGTMELSGINQKIDLRRVNAIAKAANKYYPTVQLSNQSAKCGLRPLSPDGLPYIGELIQKPGIFVATGHAMMGWSLGPITGKLIQELVDKEKTSVNTTALQIERWS